MKPGSKGGLDRRQMCRSLMALGLAGALAPKVAMAADKSGSTFATHQFENSRTRISWIEAGPSDGPLMMFIHGWPELGLIWRP
jgi:hypothetical protein